MGGMGLEATSRTAAARSFAPFAATALLAWASVPVGTPMEWDQYAVASALMLLAVALRVARLSALSGRLGDVVPSLVFLAALDLLRNSAGGISAGVSVVAMVPIFYTALHSEGKRELFVVLAGVTVFYLAPIILVGPPAYPHTQYRAALLSVAVSAIVGLATRNLVTSVREKANEASAREQMLRMVSSAVRSLLTSPQARVDVCQAAMSIGEASVAVLYEPLPGSEAMRSTAIVGLEVEEDIEIPADRPSAVRDALRSGRSILITENVAEHVGSRVLWQASGEPASVLYEPLMRGTEPIGVLVVGWSGAIDATAPQVTVVELLAHEAAAVIVRADALSELSDMAVTDPLTGLPNRRAWDTRIGKALSKGERFTVAMFDLDRFKEYNDTYGHPAGDRLLKETAAMWRHQLRSGDLLARIGGEEFALLLLDCDTSRAVDVIERLRSAVCSDRTCSVGFAERRPDETAEAVMARADEALYEAKSTGRDRACMSV
jgi:diguanylate cyclase (GGDEF)-like protein